MKKFKYVQKTVDHLQAEYERLYAVLGKMSYEEQYSSQESMQIQKVMMCLDYFYDNMACEDSLA